ncbi:MAG: saccharopine dehydrogenase NADP-binding domain-containing protein [Desulfobacterales bacterium]
MSKVIVLGGCGAVGSVAVKTLAAQEVFSEIVIADINRQRAESIISSAASKTISFTQLDAEHPESIRQAIAGSDLVVNCIGPFYKTVKTILEQVIAQKINYVDVCDDVDVTLEILNWHEKAKKAGITALIGMGSSPGPPIFWRNLPRTICWMRPGPLISSMLTGASRLKGKALSATAFIA